MKSRVFLPALLAVGLAYAALASSADAFELLNRMRAHGHSHGGGCCGGEATCCPAPACEPACCPAPACEPACCPAPACEPACCPAPCDSCCDPCGDSCGCKKRRGGLLQRLFGGRKKSCCAPACCEPACCPAPCGGCGCGH